MEKEDFPELSETDIEVELYNQGKQFLGKAYLSPQNKGIGWFVTDQNISFDQSFLKHSLKKPKINVHLIIRMI